MKKIFLRFPIEKEIVHSQTKPSSDANAAVIIFKSKQLIIAFVCTCTRESLKNYTKRFRLTKAEFICRRKKMEKKRAEKPEKSLSFFLSLPLLGKKCSKLRNEK